MKITVIIPSYQPDAYIYKCLESLNNQTLNKGLFEIMIILNGCNEPYKTDIENFIKNKLSIFLNIELIQKDMAGASNARNIGLENAKGEYITFLDDDDYVSSSYLEKLLLIANRNTVSLSNTIAFEDKTGKPENKYKKSLLFQDSKETDIIKARKYFSGPWMKLIHRDIIGDRRFDIRFENGEDSLFMFLISDKINQCKFTSKDAVYFRRNRENSVFHKKKTIGKVMTNQFRLIGEYIKLYFKQPHKYNYFFFITRLFASLHMIYNHIMIYRYK